MPTTRFTSVLRLSKSGRVAVMIVGMTLIGARLNNEWTMIEVPEWEC